MDNPFETPVVRNDASLMNLLTEMGTSNDKSQYTTPGQSVRFSDVQLELLHEQPLINAYCSAIPDAAISKPLEFNFGSKNGKLDAKKSREIVDWLDEFHVLEKTARAQTYANVYGGAAIVYFVDDGQPQDEPLNLKKAKKLLGTRVLDRQMVIPRIEAATTLEDISHYDVSTHGMKIDLPGIANNTQIRFHKSRIIPFYGLYLTDNAMLQRYNGWGKSTIEAIWESYRDYRTGILASSGNLGDSSLAIVSMDGFVEMLRANDTETIKSVFASVKNMASNQGMMLIDKTKQDIRYVERQFTGVSQVIDKLREDFIGNSRIQHDKLFGESPSGLGATGEAEEKNWAKEVRQYQERRWRRLLRKQFEILLSLPDSPLKGELPEQWSFSFPSIIELSEDQELANRATQSTIDSTYQSLGILTTDEIRQSRYAGSKFSYETTLDEKAYEEAKKKAEEEATGGFGGYGDFGGYGGEEEVAATEPTPEEQAALVPEEDAPLQGDSLERERRLDAMRPSCMDCVTKHLGSALIKGREVENGYPEHIILVVGELSEAEQEVEAISQEAADMIRDLRRDCWAKRRSPMFEEVLAIYDVLGYEWGAEEEGSSTEIEVPNYREPSRSGDGGVYSISRTNENGHIEQAWVSDILLGVPPSPHGSHIDSASAGIPARSPHHLDDELEPIIKHLEEGDHLISDLPGEYWDEYQNNGEPPYIEGYECIGVTPEDCDWSCVGLEPVYRESSTAVGGEKFKADNKYSHIDFTPPEGVRKAAARGLEIRRSQPKSKKGGLTNKEASDEGIGSGVQRAVNLKNGDTVSPKVVKQMKAFFDRHSAFKHKHKEDPLGKAKTSWDLWGGDAGYSWAKKVVAQMEAADKERSDAIARFNKKYNDSLTEELLLKQDSSSPVYEWVEGYTRGDSRVPGYVRYYRDRKGSSTSKKKESLTEEEDPVALSVEASVEKAQPIIDQWIDTLTSELGKATNYQSILDGLPELAKKLPLDDLGQIVQEGNIVNYLDGAAIEDDRQTSSP